MAALVPMVRLDAACRCSRSRRLDRDRRGGGTGRRDRDTVLEERRHFFDDGNGNAPLEHAALVNVLSGGAAMAGELGFDFAEAAFVVVTLCGSVESN